MDIGREGEVRKEGMVGKEDLVDRGQVSQVAVNKDQGREWSGC